MISGRRQDRMLGTDGSSKMTRKTWVAVLSCSVVLGVIGHLGVRAHAQQPQQQQPDTIYYNGRILTVATDRGQFPIAEAVAVGGGKILAVGPTAKIRALAGPKTRSIDLKGKAMMPGLINTHKHPNRDALMNYWEWLPVEWRRHVQAAGMIYDMHQKSNVLQVIKGIARSAPQELPVVVISARGLLGFVGYGSTLLINAPAPGLAESRGIGGDEFPRLAMTVADLDSVTGGRPVIIAFGRGGMMNTAAINLAMAKGVYPTGRFNPAKDYCCLPDLLPPPPPSALAPLYRLELSEKNAPLGYTTISSMFTPQEIETFGIVDAAGHMAIRVAYGYQLGRLRTAQYNKISGDIKATATKYNSDMLWMNGVSGVPGLGSSVDGGATCTSYGKDKSFSADFNFNTDDCYNWDNPKDETLEVLRGLNKEGYRCTNMHTWADIGPTKAMEFYEKISADRPVAGRQFTFDHTSIFTQREIDLSAKLGMMWSVIPTAFATQRGAMMRQALGNEVMDAFGAPVGRLIDAGVKVTFEGEFDAASPWKGFTTLVTRKDDTGVVRGAGNAVDRWTALRMMTRWGAEYVNAGKRLGSIEPGKEADLIVLDRDPLDPKLSDDELVQMQVLLTLVNGKVVYRHTSFEM